MIRIKRILKSTLSEDSALFVRDAALWEQELRQRLSPECAALTATTQEDGEYVNFYTERDGAMHELSRGETLESYERAHTSFERQKAELLSSLKEGDFSASPRLMQSREAYIRLLEQGGHVVLFDEVAPVYLPYITKEEEQEHQAAAVPDAPPARGRGCLWPLLWLLLLLVGLLLLWWFCLRPWPAEGTLGNAWRNFLDRAGIISWFKPDTGEQQQLLNEIQHKVDAMLADLEVQERVKAEEEAERLKAEEEERLKAEEEARLKAEEEAAAKLAALEEEKRKAEEEAAARLAALEEEKRKAEEEAARLKAAQEEQQKAQAQSKQSEQSKKSETKTPSAQEKSTAKDSGGKALPKCTTLKQQGKLPKMVIAFDGSQSMLLRDVGTSRLSAATQAASTLVDNIDKNVQIGLVEINGCSAAKNRGFYTGTQRSALKQQIKGIDPMRYDGRTPLVDALTKMANMVDGVNAEAVGILISDGEDTCPLTAKMDICQVASAIHKRKPKLKINTILIGRDAQKAACVARVTGGKVYSPSSAAQINAQLQASGAEFKKVCKD
ncbi:MAG: VWA domain-containing protein [Succinivibrio sp.]|nr:VWA domain-containing protein [Succinivibrio sp.]